MKKQIVLLSVLLAVTALSALAEERPSEEQEIKISQQLIREPKIRKDIQ